MNSRLRGLVAVAILIALAAHPLAHPLLKECPCVHEVATAALSPAQSVVLTLASDGVEAPVDRADEPPALSVGGARAPPAA